MPSPLIDVQTLSEKLDDPSWITVDCRFRLTDPAAGRAAYDEGHIPGSRYAHMDDDLAAPVGPDDGRHPLPPAEVFARTLGEWGISNSSTVVVHDDASGAVAARLWWMLRWLGHERVLVLDGGFPAWTAAGFPTQSAAPAWEPADFAASEIRDDWVVRTNDIPGEVALGAALVDARSRERFSGEAEPIDPVAGHVPGSVNYPFSDALTSNGFLRPPGDLHEDLRGFTEQPRGFIAMCGSGVTACHLLLAANAAGLADGRIYIGSWSEWIRDTKRVIATGEAAVEPAS